MDNAFSYIKANGIETEEAYPYKAKVRDPNILTFQFGSSKITLM